MKNIETIATVTADGKLTILAPADIKPGNYRIRAELDETPVVTAQDETLTIPKRGNSGKAGRFIAKKS